jgi:large-conductance mechanosensitive channel
LANKDSAGVPPGSLASFFFLYQTFFFKMLLDTFQILASAPVEAGGDEGAVGEILRKFHVSWPSFIAQWVNFIIICLLLKKFAYAPVLEILDKRRNRIAEGEAKMEAIQKKLDESEQ